LKALSSDKEETKENPESKYPQNIEFEGSCSVGRKATNALALNNASISGAHCTITSPTLTDSSTVGTFYHMRNEFEFKTGV
jgi:hypothetical protein